MNKGCAFDMNKHAPEFVPQDITCNMLLLPPVVPSVCIYPSPPPAWNPPSFRAPVIPPPPIQSADSVSGHLSNFGNTFSNAELGQTQHFGGTATDNAVESILGNSVSIQVEQVAASSGSDSTDDSNEFADVAAAPSAAATGYAATEVDAHVELIGIIHDSLPIHEFVKILENTETNGVELGAIHDQIPTSVRDAFFVAATEYGYTNMFAVGRVYDTIVSSLVANGIPVRQYMQELCADEDDFDHKFAMIMTPIT